MAHPHWVTDNSPGFKVDGALVKNVQKKETKPCNAMWQDVEDGVRSGKHFWNIRFPTLEGAAGVGLTSKDHFKQGYDCQAIQLLKGDLRNGGHNDCLIPKFYKYKEIEAGDEIGILAVFEEHKLKVYFEVNGVSLGPGFFLSDKIFKSIFPIVTFYNSGSATCTKLTEIRDITFRPRPIHAGILGDWKATNMTANNVIYQQIRRITSEFTEIGPDKYKWVGQVKRTFETVAARENGKWSTETLRTLPAIIPANDPPTLDLEDRLRTLMENVIIIEHDPDEDILFTETERISIRWKRYDPSPGPFCGDPFDR